jgi:hypothetical protein
MADQIKVRAKAGATLPHMAPQRGFVGYDRVTDDSVQEGDHVVPGGARYRPIESGELVPNTVHYRRALARGDIEEVQQEGGAESALPELDQPTPRQDPPREQSGQPVEALANALRTHAPTHASRKG